MKNYFENKNSRKAAESQRRVFLCDSAALREIKYRTTEMQKL